MTSTYLQDTPNYYIDGGDQIMNQNDIPDKVNDIIFDEKYISKISDKSGIYNFDFSHGKGSIECYTRPSIDGDLPAMVIQMSSVKLKSQGQEMYLSLAHFLRSKYTLYSAAQSSLSDDAKFLWNSLVDRGIAKYNSVHCRFYIQNITEI